MPGCLISQKQQIGPWYISVVEAITFWCRPAIHIDSRSPYILTSEKSIHILNCIMLRMKFLSPLSCNLFFLTKVFLVEIVNAEKEHKKTHVPKIWFIFGFGRTELLQRTFFFLCRSLVVKVEVSIQFESNYKLFFFNAKFIIRHWTKPNNNI